MQSSFLRGFGYAGNRQGVARAGSGGRRCPVFVGLSHTAAESRAHKGRGRTWLGCDIGPCQAGPRRVGMLQYPGTNGSDGRSTTRFLPISGLSPIPTQQIVQASERTRQTRHEIRKTNDARGSDSLARQRGDRREGSRWRHRPAGPDARARSVAGGHRRHQGHRGNAAHHQGCRRLPHRRGCHRRRAQGASDAVQGLAGPDRGRQLDRLDPGPGPRQPRRQPLQRIAGRRQRAGPDRRPRQGGHRWSLGPARAAGRGHHARPAQAGADQGRDHRCLQDFRRKPRTAATPTCASSRAPRWTSPSSAAASH